MSSKIDEMENRNPLVSVILTSYNQCELLKIAFNSLLNQTYPNLEIIIADDFSTDSSRDIIESWVNEYPTKVVKVFQASNVGIPKNKNAGFKMAKGDFITYLDGDDYYYPNKIEKEIEEFKNDPTLDVVFSNFNFIKFNGEVKESWISCTDFTISNYPLDEIANRKFPKSILFRFELIRKEVLKKINYYNESLSIYHDWDSRIRYACFAKIGYANNIGSVYVEDPAGITQRNKQIVLIKQMLYVLELNHSSLLLFQINTKELCLSLNRSLLLLEISDHNCTKTKKMLLVYLYILRNPFDKKLYKCILDKLFK